MGWEERKGRLYYYQKRRIGNRVVSSYVGPGLLGRMAQILDECEWLKRKQKREQENRECEVITLETDKVIQVIDMIRILTYTALIINGYSSHKGQWRKRRANIYVSPPTKKFGKILDRTAKKNPNWLI